PAAYAGTVYVDELQILAPPTSENFDRTPLGQLPAGWSQWTNAPGAGFKTDATQAQSGAQSLISTSTSSNAQARAWVGAPLAANVQTATSVLLNSLVPLRLFARGNNLGTLTPTYYAASITRGLEVSLLRVVNGIVTEIGKVKSAVYFSNQWVKLSLIIIGDRVEALVYRADTGEYLGPDGNWRSGLARAVD